MGFREDAISAFSSFWSSIKTLLAGKQDALSFPKDASKYLNGNGEFTTPPNTTYGVVSTSNNGLAPKLTGATNVYLNGNGGWTTPPNTTYNPATQDTNGLMSSGDKKAVDNMVSTIHQEGVRVGICDSAADATTKVVTMVDGLAFTLQSCRVLAIRFTNGNTAESFTLNVAGTGAKEFDLGGGSSAIAEGATILLYYW